MEVKLDRLVDEMKVQIDRIERGANDGPDLLEIVKLFYD
jgi:hypothetical protein